ncbi:cytochrome B561, N terminal-domain-containing protein [Entophlyctis helioformis]|nr:cytochrome B561, N terminal-domain-containing protein [Entophlyctis helioformis]
MTPIKRRPTSSSGASPASPGFAPPAASSPAAGYSAAGYPLAGDSGWASPASASAGPARRGGRDSRSGGSGSADSAAAQLLLEPSLFDLLSQRSLLVLSESDRTVFSTNAKLLSLSLALLVLLGVKLLVWPPSYLTLIASGLSILCTFNLLTITFRFIYPRSAKIIQASSGGKLAASPTPIESRGAAWSPVKASPDESYGLFSPDRQQQKRLQQQQQQQQQQRSGAANVSLDDRQSPFSPSVRASMAKIPKFLLRGSPMRKDVPMINDRQDLTRFLGETDRRLEQLEPVNGSASKDPFANTFGSLAASTPSIPRFQPAIKPTATLVAKEVIEDGLPVKDAAKLLDEWKTEPYMDEWAESMRKWLATRLLDPLVRRIQETDEKLAALQLQHLGCSFAASAEGVQIRMAAATKPAVNISPARPSELADCMPKEPLVAERVTLERYLEQFANRDYVIDRIKVLAKGSCLAQFQWNSGQAWKGKPWTHESFPSDAELVMGLFCKYLDEHIRILEPHKKSGFTDKHFLPSGAKPPASMSSIMIREQAKWPAHYQLVFENAIWDIYPDRNNLFHTLALFVFYIKSASSGYIGMLYIGGRALELADTVAVGPIVNRFMTPAKGSMSSYASGATGTTSAVKSVTGAASGRTLGTPAVGGLVSSNATPSGSGSAGIGLGSGGGGSSSSKRGPT